VNKSNYKKDHTCDHEYVADNPNEPVDPTLDEGQIEIYLESHYDAPTGLFRPKAPVAFEYNLASVDSLNNPDLA
jgi:hypothetical protein